MERRGSFGRGRSRGVPDSDWRSATGVRSVLFLENERRTGVHRLALLSRRIDRILINVVVSYFDLVTVTDVNSQYSLGNGK